MHFRSFQEGCLGFPQCTLSHTNLPDKKQHFSHFQRACSNKYDPTQEEYPIFFCLLCLSLVQPQPGAGVKQLKVQFRNVQSLDFAAALPSSTSQGWPAQINYRNFSFHTCNQYSPNIRMFFPEGNFELDLVETSLSIEDLQIRKRQVDFYIQVTLTVIRPTAAPHLRGVKRGVKTVNR